MLKLDIVWKLWMRFVRSCNFLFTAALFSPVDNFPPTITCAANVNQQIQCGQTSTQVNFPATATDNCGTATVIYSSQGTTNFFSQSQSSATMNVGLSTITATATDTSGRTATCTTQVTITEGIWARFEDTLIYMNIPINISYVNLAV